MQASLNRPITLEVYNSTTNDVREVKLTPSANWPGEGLIGLKMKMTTYSASGKVRAGNK